MRKFWAETVHYSQSNRLHFLEQMIGPEDSWRREGVQMVCQAEG